jgi:DNA-binding response OmpR family regulator/HPt (histidine-containing phosphotransfer) domain-containing protein
MLPQVVSNVFADTNVRAMRGIQILVVEGNATQAKLVGFLLEEAGHTVQTAENAERALDVMQTFVPDLFLVDLDLPGMDGLELTRELRLGVHSRTPIVVLTGCSDQAELASAREAGCNGTISKPIDTAAFERQVRNYAVGKPGGDADIRPDYGDLLAEVRNSFLAEGLEECGMILNRLKATPVRAMQVAPRLLHRWAEAAGTLGFPGIAQHARRVEVLLASAGLESDELEKAIETARRRFFVAARNELELPLELIQGLSGVRIGLVDFSEEEAHRVQRAAKSANVKLVMEHMKGVSVDAQAGYNALIINECALSAEATERRPRWTVPAIFIGSRASLQALSKLPLHAYDFVIAPWDAAEILIRAYRLIGKQTAAQPERGIRKRRPRVLIADDDPDMVSLVTATLGQSGMEFEIARSGRQTLDAVRARRPDAIVLDVNMPDLDGFEILKKLRQNLSTKTIPVLMLTARNQGSDITQGFGSGADDYVIKPFDPSDLVKRVETMISSSRRVGTSLR